MKVKGKKFSVISFSAAGILFVLCILVAVLNERDIYIYFSGIGTEELIPILIVAAAAFSAAGGIVLICRASKRKALAAWLLSAAEVLAIGILALLLFFLCDTGRYYEFTSPDNEHKIVVNESSFFLSWGDIYEKRSVCTLKKIGDYTADDGFTPLEHDQYYITWTDTGFELHYSFSGYSYDEYEVVIIEYPE